MNHPQAAILRLLPSMPAQDLATLTAIFKVPWRGVDFERLLCLGKKWILHNICAVSYDWKNAVTTLVPPKNYTCQRNHLKSCLCRSTCRRVFRVWQTSAGCCAERLYGLPLLSTIIAGALKKAATEMWLTILGIFVRMIFLLKFECYTEWSPKLMVGICGNMIDMVPSILRGSGYSKVQTFNDAWREKAMVMIDAEVVDTRPLVAVVTHDFLLSPENQNATIVLMMMKVMKMMTMRRIRMTRLMRMRITRLRRRMKMRRRMTMGPLFASSFAVDPIAARKQMRTHPQWKLPHVTAITRVLPLFLTTCDNTLHLLFMNLTCCFSSNASLVINLAGSPSMMPLWNWWSLDDLTVISPWLRQTWVVQPLHQVSSATRQDCAVRLFDDLVGMAGRVGNGAEVAWGGQTPMVLCKRKGENTI